MYIMATSLAVTLIAVLGLEGHHLQEMFGGHLLFITSVEVAVAYGLYLMVALVLVVAHKHF